MFNSHKSQIVIQTLTPYAVAYAIFCLVQLGNPLADVLVDWKSLFALTFFSVGLSMLQDLVPKAFKEWLVFFRVTNRLPGHRAFSTNRRWSSVISRDEVLDFETREQLGQKYQDRLFYRIYDEYRDVGSVRHYSFRYLQWRELATIALISGLVGYSAVGLYVGWYSTGAILALAVAAVVMALSIVAARNAANALVDRVLLAEATSKARKV